ncbi:MAG: hypothetical protein WCQ90_10790 [Deltaproteobacteria bacterium]
MERLYISVKRESTCRSLRSTFLIICFFIGCIFVLFLTKGANNQLRDELVDRLMIGRETIEANNNLKMELTVITRARYLEFKTKERLGLKKPKEEEVLVLR